MRSRAFTLLELIIAVSIVIIAFYALIQVFVNVVPKGVNVEEMTKATYLAQRAMEETIVKGFASVESAGASAFPAPFSQFSHSIAVSYVTTAEPDVVAGSPTNFKRVKARAWGPGMTTIEITTLVTTYEL